MEEAMANSDVCEDPLLRHTEHSVLPRLAGSAGDPNLVQVPHIPHTITQFSLTQAQTSSSAHIDALPAELLIESLRWLDLPSLKAARFTCRQWAEAGAYSLFNRLYFAPRHDLMDIFKSITEKPAFAANVTEIVYDARMFWNHMAQRSAYSKKFMREMADRYLDLKGGSGVEYDHPDYIAGLLPEEQRRLLEEVLNESLRQYKCRLQEQTSIIASRRDFEVLCAGLERLPKVTQMSVMDRFEHPLDSQPFMWSQHEWYNKWFSEQHKATARPSRWAEAEYVWAEADYSKDVMNDYPWDFQGIDNLFEAAILHAPRIEKILIGGQISNLSADLYNTATVANAMAQLAPRLTMLKVDCVLARIADGSVLTRILRRADRLQELHITLPNHFGYVRSLSEGRKWPLLRVLDLGHGDFDYPLLKDFSTSHVDTLREVRFRTVNLRSGEAWEVAATELGKVLKLDLVALSFVSSRFGSMYRHVGEERTVVIAQRFMQRIPKHQLGMVGELGFVVAWHKQDYTPTLGFDMIRDKMPNVLENHDQA